MADVLRRLNSGVAKLQRAFLFVLMSILSLAMLAEVITRYFFNTSLFGLEQFIGYAAVWLYFIGASYGSYERTHIKAEFINIIVRSSRQRDGVCAFSGAVSTAMSAVFVKWSWDFCVESVKMHETTPTHGVPMIYFQSALLVGAVLMTIYFTWETIEYSHRFIKGR
jgi:TRAP-type C4-dicarboxylate transport system permease small subunit